MMGWTRIVAAEDKMVDPAHIVNKVVPDLKTD